MIKTHCKRDYKGNVDIRSHIVEKAIQNDEKIKVTCGTFEGESIYSVKELKQPLWVQGPFKSKYEGEYKLHVYKWKNK